MAISLQQKRVILVVLLLFISWIQFNEFSKAYLELEKEIERGNRLTQTLYALKNRTTPITTSNTIESYRHVFFSSNHDVNSSLIRKSALLLPKTTVLYFKNEPISELFQTALSLIPDAHTYTYFHGEESLHLFNLSMIQTLDSILYFSEVEKRVSPRFMLQYDNSKKNFFLSFSRLVWDWKKVPLEANEEWIVDKVRQLHPLISVIHTCFTSSLFLNSASSCEGSNAEYITKWDFNSQIKLVSANGKILEAEKSSSSWLVIVIFGFIFLCGYYCFNNKSNLLYGWITRRKIEVMRKLVVQ